MSVLEIKNLLHQIIANTEDEQLLKLLFMITQEKKDSLNWEELPEAAKTLIQKGISEIEEGKGISHEVMRDKYKAWL